MQPNVQIAPAPDPAPESAPVPALAVRGLAMSRDDRDLFSDLSFAVETGEIVQIEGANGSGKTTLLRILCGLLLPDAGTVYWQGAPIDRTRSAYQADLAYLGHLHGVKDDLTAEENLAMAMALSARRASAEPHALLERVGLRGFEDAPARSLSAGQRRRVAFARLLASAAPLWILDEPFTALDRAGREMVEQMLETHCLAGGLAVLTTHHSMNHGTITTRHIQL